MNFDQIMEALGLEKLASAQGGSGSAGPGGTAPASGQPPRQPGPPTEPDEPPAGEPPLPEEDDQQADAPTFDWSEDEEFDEGPEPVEEPVDDLALEEIRHEIDQIAADVESNASHIRGVQSKHEEVLERLDSIEEHNSQLLGIYDRLTAGINPFAEDWEARYDRARENPEAADNRYNVIEPPGDVDRDPVAPEAATEPEPDDDPVEAAVDDAETVGFEDIRDRRGTGEGSDPTATDDPPGDRDARRVDSGGDESAVASDDDAYLAALSRGYATEVLLMEWLTMLIDIAGPPGALKALDYYENIGWISRPVKHQLEDLLGGARVPAETTARRPGDLTTEEHNRSFAYIMKLEQQRPGSPPDVHLD